MRRVLLMLVVLLVGSRGLARAGELYFTEYVEGSGSNKALEIRNDTGASVALAPWAVSVHFNGSTGAGLTVALAGSLPAGGVHVLASASADAAVLAQADQLVTGTWFNGDDAVVLRKDGVPIDVIGQIGFDPGSQWGARDASTADNTLRRLPSVTSGDPDGSDAFDPSAQWAGWPGDTFTGLGSYPDADEIPVPVGIPAIQGAGHVSPWSGTLVQTSGIVTAVEGHGFYLQDAAGDGDLLTSDGLFVYTAAVPPVSVGDGVTVTGAVSEFQPGGPATANLSVTELAGAAVVILGSGHPLPEPAVLGAAGSLPPVAIVDDDGLLLFDPASDGIDFYETVEGMRVRIDDALAVSAANEYGEIVVVTDGGQHATGMNARSGITLGPADANPERIQVQLDPDLAPGQAPVVVTGDSLGDVTGVVGYDFGNYEVKLTQAFAVRAAGLAPETAPPVPAGDVLAIATCNVLNLDPQVESLALVGSIADIDDDVGEGRFRKLAAQIVQHLRAPEILALQEIQDNDGAEQTAETDASLTWQTLVQAIAAAGGPAYDYRDLPPEDDADGGQPGGNIRVGFLFDPARVTIDAASLQKVPDPGGFAFAGARKPLTALFEFRGRRVRVLNGHFSSKSGSTPLFGVVQPPVNGALAKRIAQAEVVHDFVEDVLEAEPDVPVVVLGDLNEFSFNAPLDALKGGSTPILHDLSDTLAPAERYSYVFEGNAQDLDHILVSSALVGRADYDVVHVNAEFGSQLPPRASDHDPVLTRIAFRDVCQPDLGSGGPGTVALTVCGDPLRPSGVAILTVSGLTAGGAGLLFYGLASAAASSHGGVLVPMAPAGTVLLTDEDGDGAVTLPVSGALSAVPIDIVLQCLALDAGGGLDVSNAVEVQFLGG